jgi:sterol desaturase/sphingolipid hydroxylase (fatty acid hydroxylase superfamily)
MMDWYTESIAWLFENALQPLLYLVGAMRVSEQAYQWLWLAGIGVGFMLFMWIVIRPLERSRPVETQSDSSAVRNDIGYTALAQLGLLPLIPAAILVLIFDPLDGALRSAGFTPWSLEQAFPALNQSPALAFLLYVVIIDFVFYWLHRSQHVIKPLWELHAIHHSQQHMTFWSDAREHVISYVYYAFVFACIGLLIGAGRESAFLLAGYVVRFVQSLSHANVKLSFGPVLGRVLVSPQFHRVHHAIGIGHEGKHAGVNFGGVFAFWDVLFGTGNHRDIYPRTGVKDQLKGRDYGASIWSQQWLALKRVVGRA